LVCASKVGRNHDEGKLSKKNFSEKESLSGVEVRRTRETGGESE